jgi:hypothetical protein
MTLALASEPRTPNPERQTVNGERELPQLAGFNIYMRIVFF